MQRDAILKHLQRGDPQQTTTTDSKLSKSLQQTTTRSNQPLRALLDSTSSDSHDFRTIVKPTKFASLDISSSNSSLTTPDISPKSSAGYASKPPDIHRKSSADYAPNAPENYRKSSAGHTPQTPADISGKSSAAECWRFASPQHRKQAEQLQRQEEWVLDAENWDAVSLALQSKTPRLVNIREHPNSESVPADTLTAVLEAGEKLQELQLVLLKSMNAADEESAKRDGEALQRAIQNNW